jgi:hypothetical protein
MFAHMRLNFGPFSVAVFNGPALCTSIYIKHPWDLEYKTDKNQTHCY